MSRRAWTRTRIGRSLIRCLIASTTLSACSPAARVYSVVPVDREGAPVDIGRIDLIRFDDGTRRSLLPGESLSLVGRTLVLEGTPRADGSRPSESFAVRSVESFRQPLEDGTDHWIEIRTPGDLDEFDTLPRIHSIDTAQGERVVLGEESGRSARWSADRLAIVIDGAGSDQVERIELDTIARVELFVPDALGATLASPGFWIVGAAAAGLVIWLAGAQDEDTLATN